MEYFDIKSGEWVEEECVEENGFVVNTKGELIKYKDFDNHVTIPREVKGIPITSIGDGMIYFMGGYAFYGCKNLVSVIIADSITSIGNSAFSFCKNLISITISNSVTSIGDSAFGGCRSLTDIIIPDSVTFIGRKAFVGCSSLTNVRIPASVTFIGESAFSGCCNLKDIIIDKENVTFINIDGVLFDKQQHSLLLYPAEKPNTSYIIPDGVKIIGNSAFYNCYNLKN
ncbi:MAG: leucine-rich repeat domain-containing protein, partial [Lachnospiraceae bacterium]|nr:leucine-rich repeat domain-containing protein [Lachnospiraceae bacterium]